MTTIGRPPTYSIENHGDALCAELALGRSLRSVCKDEGMPSIAVVMGWLRVSEPFQAQYARAKEEAADALADEIVEIADDGSNDWMEKLDKDSQPVGWLLNGEHVQRSKLRVDARKWIAAKLKPKKYGDRTQHEHTGKLSLESLVAGSAEPGAE